jgi:hypothetical protein
MTFDDEALKRYGLPKSMVERALIKVYETVPPPGPRIFRKADFGR